MTRIVAIYARVSTEHEAQLSALENQVQYYDNILAQHPDWKLYKRYIDEGITGTSIRKRKNFLQMIEDANNGCFDLIITREVSRFARNTVDTLQETRKLRRIGVEVFFTEDNIWTFNDEDGELKLTIMATLAQNESKKTSQRVKAGQKISFENGVFYGNGNILGYDYNKYTKEVTINEDQAKIVKLMFSLFLEGKGSTIIKYELEKKGYLTSTGLKNWSPSYITRILRNSFYCGTIIYRKSFIPDYLEQKAKRNTGEVQQVIIEGKHQPIISKEDFEKVQEIMNSRSKTITEKKKIGHGIPKNIWTKKLECECGSSFNKRVYHKKEGTNTTYCYQCYKQKNKGSKKTRLKKGLDIEDACDIPMVQEWKLFVMANVIFNTIWGDKEKIIDIANQLIDETIKDNDYDNEIDIDINSNKNKIITYNKKLDKLLEMYLNEMLSKDEYIKKKSEFEQCINELNKNIENMEQKRGIPKATLEDKIKLLKKSIEDNLNYNEEYVSDEVIDSFVEKVIVQKDKYVWKLNYLNDIIDMDIKGHGNSSKVHLCIDSAEMPTELYRFTSSFKREYVKVD